MTIKLLPYETAAKIGRIINVPDENGMVFGSDVEFIPAEFFGKELLAQVDRTRGCFVYGGFCISPYFVERLVR